MLSQLRHKTNFFNIGIIISSDKETDENKEVYLQIFFHLPVAVFRVVYFPFSIHFIQMTNDIYLNNFFYVHSSSPIMKVQVEEKITELDY